MASNAQESIVNLLLSILFKYTTCLRKNYHQIVIYLISVDGDISCNVLRHRTMVSPVSWPDQGYWLFMRFGQSCETCEGFV